MLDVREAAERAGRTPETVRRWIWTGRLVARRHGNRLLIRRRDLEELLQGTPQGGLTLAGWARLVDAQRASGALGVGAREASAAQLVLDDRAARERG